MSADVEDRAEFAERAVSFDSALIPADEVLLEDLQDPEFREDWNKTAPARWLAIELAHYRAEHGLTQAQLAEHLGVDPEDVERMEDGTENPSLQELMCIAQRLGIEISARRSVQPSRQSESVQCNLRARDPRRAEMTPVFRRPEAGT